jgi:hypothetical protein
MANLDFAVLAGDFARVVRTPRGIGAVSYAIYFSLEQERNALGGLGCAK